MKSRIVQLILGPVIAFAVLLTGTGTAHAAPTTRESTEAKAIRTVQAVEKSLRATGSAVFTGADGKDHRITLSATTLIVDGFVASAAPVQPDGSAAPAGWACNIKVGLAIAAITAVGAIAIWAWIAGLPVTAPVTIAGLTFTAATWSTIASILAAGGSLVPILQGLLC